MSELSPRAVYATLQEDSKRGPLAKTLLAARVVAITAAVAGAVPTAMTLYQSWMHGIPYREVSHRLEQYDIWVRNFDCRIDYRALTTAQGTRVDAGACGKTGDVSIKVTTPKGKAAYEWIGFGQLQKAGTTSWLEAIGAVAHAGDRPTRLAEGTTPGAGAAGMKVMCQAMPQKGVVLRIVQDGPKCYREQVSLFRGSVEKREEVACTTPCK
jgi:hypothetical protein